MKGKYQTGTINNKANFYKTLALGATYLVTSILPGCASRLGEFSTEPVQGHRLIPPKKTSTIVSGDNAVSLEDTSRERIPLQELEGIVPDSLLYKLVK